MPRRALCHTNGQAFHVLNRSAKRSRLFFTDSDYLLFEVTLVQALDRFPVRLLAYCVMPNHWHLVLWPVKDELPRFMHWLTLTHAQRWHRTHHSEGTGHVYQSRYKAIPIQQDRHLLTVLRYVERNPLRAGLVSHAESWRWGSFWRRGENRTDLPLAEWPFPQPYDWHHVVNGTEEPADVELIRSATQHNRPLGDASWIAANASRLGVRRQPGRPRKNPDRV